MKAGLSQTLTADGSTDWFEMSSSVCQIALGGVFGAGTIAVEVRHAVTGQPIPMVKDNAAVTYTVIQADNIMAPQGSLVRATLSGSTSPGLSVSILDITDATFRA